jgi:presequence protease
MKGVEEGNVERVEQLVLDTLKSLSEEGFHPDAVRASINSVEFHLREYNTGGYPKGLSIMLGCMSEWIYDRDPLNGIRFETALGEMKRDLAEGKPVFQDMLTKLFLTNQHRVAVQLVPDEALEETQLESEKQALEKVKASMTEAQLQEVIQTTASLRAAQAAEDPPEAKETIPRLSLDDIDPLPKEIPEEVHHVLGSNGILLTHELPSAGILYADIGLDFSRVPLEDVGLLPLFSRMLLECGTATMDEVALSRKIDAETGGIMASWYSDLKSKTGVVSDPNDVILYFMLRGKCTEDKIPILFDLLSEVLLTAKLDNKKRAVEMLLESKAHRVDSVVSSGHRFGATRLSSKYSFLGYMAENTGGLSYLRSLDALLDQAENDWPALEKRLENIRSVIIGSSDDEAMSIRGNQFVINLTGDRKVLDAGQEHMSSFVSAVRMKSRNLPSSFVGSGRDIVETWKTKVKQNEQEQLTVSADGSSASPVDYVGEGFTMNSQVNYVIKGGVMLEPGQEVKGSYSVVSRHLSNGYLWDHVRVMGGAYGGFGKFSSQSGRFVYASYRDPNLLETLNIYDGASAALTNEEISNEDLLSDIMGTIGDMDSPMSVDQKGYSAMARYLAQESPKDRIDWRNEILHTKPEDFREFAAKLKSIEDKGHVVVFGSKTALEDANSKLPDGKKLKVAPAFGAK